MIKTLSIDSMPDDTLLLQFGELVRQDREGNADLLRHIDVIDQRKLWARLGHSSLFGCLVARYHMSESTAGKRIGAMRTARRFPLLFSMVARGEVHLSGVHRLKAHLTPENHEQVLTDAKHKTIRQIEELVACLTPQPDAPSRLRALPNRTTTATTPAATLAPPVTACFPAPTPSPAAPSLTPSVPEPAPPLYRPSRRASDPTPLAPGRFKLQVTLSQSSHDKRRRAPLQRDSET